MGYLLLLMKPLLLLLLLVFSSGPVQAKHVRTCTEDYGSNVNLRKGPSTSSKAIALIPDQSPVRIYSFVWGTDNRRWYRVETNGLVGFILEDYVCY